MVLEFSIANEVDKIKVAKKYSYPMLKEPIYVAKENGIIVGFVGFNGKILEKIFLDKKFRVKNNAKKLFEFSVKDYLSKNKKFDRIELRAAQRGKRQQLLERWYLRIGGIRHPDPLRSDNFFFLKPKKGENFLDAKNRFNKKRR